MEHSRSVLVSKQPKLCNNLFSKCSNYIDHFSNFPVQTDSKSVCLVNLFIYDEESVLKNIAAILFTFGLFGSLDYRRFLESSTEKELLSSVAHDHKDEVTGYSTYITHYDEEYCTHHSFRWYF